MYKKFIILRVSAQHSISNKQKNVLIANLSYKVETLCIKQVCTRHNMKNYFRIDYWPETILLQKLTRFKAATQQKIIELFHQKIYKF